MDTKIHIKREKAFADFARKYKIIINGEPKGKIKNGGEFECEVAPGPVTLQLTIDWCGSRPVVFEAKPGTTTQIACGSNLRGWKIFKANKILKESPYDWIWVQILTP